VEPDSEEPPLIAGLDIRKQGASDEQLLLASMLSVSGGRERSTGLFAQDIFGSQEKWTVHCRRSLGTIEHFLRQHGQTPCHRPPLTALIYPDETRIPSAALISPARLEQYLFLSVSGYRAFAPYVMNFIAVSTRHRVYAKQSFSPCEKLTGAETGIRAVGFDSRLESRATFFWGGHRRSSH